MDCYAKMGDIDNVKSLFNACCQTEQYMIAIIDCLARKNELDCAESFYHQYCHEKRYKTSQTYHQFNTNNHYSSHINEKIKLLSIKK